MIKGYSHIGVSTHNMEATIYFYTEILGFKLVADHLTLIKEGGQLRQVYFDTGLDEYLVFMEPKEIDSIPSSYPTGINAALGTPAGMYHIAFKIETLEALDKYRSKLIDAGIEVSECIDLGHAKSIFFADPNDLQIECCCHTRRFELSDLKKVEEASVAT